ncbi:hypothetical protein BDA99DRAFT_582190 [Phascolomyces articulosus]|uniref:Uncharacterized protein n=1 Tax=Phascolomyces articulosus TaxID=60185 RepID=A0AAD5PDC5_9FUNG|nr:hypothetical protein BDA99DRAFT_582190 [Phascolomyces articulosus]
MRLFHLATTTLLTFSFVLGAPGVVRPEQEAPARHYQNVLGMNYFYDMTDPGSRYDKRQDPSNTTHVADNLADGGPGPAAEDAVSNNGSVDPVDGGIVPEGGGAVSEGDGVAPDDVIVDDNGGIIVGGGTLNGAGMGGLSTDDSTLGSLEVDSAGDSPAGLINTADGLLFVKHDPEYLDSTAQEGNGTVDKIPVDVEGDNEETNNEPAAGVEGGKDKTDVVPVVVEDDENKNDGVPVAVNEDSVETPPVDNKDELDYFNNEVGFDTDEEVVEDNGDEVKDPDTEEAEAETEPDGDIVSDGSSDDYTDNYEEDAY